MFREMDYDIRTWERVLVRKRENHMFKNKAAMITGDVHGIGQRYLWIDNIRAVAMISMITYHAVWDLVYLYGMNWGWYRSDSAFLWQQSICWTFILLSGFCWSFSKNPLKQGIVVTVGGLIVTVVTLLFSYDSRVIFGVLNLIGVSALLMIPLKKYFEKISSMAGFFFMFVLFGITYGINDRHLGFFDLELLELPRELYRNLLTTFVGFPAAGFYSSDYFSLLPWSFLYFAGYFLYRMWNQKLIPEAKCMDKRMPVFTWLGKHSLIIYMIHQPILYGVLEVVFRS